MDAQAGTAILNLFLSDVFAILQQLPGGVTIRRLPGATIRRRPRSHVVINFYSYLPCVPACLAPALVSGVFFHYT